MPKVAIVGVGNCCSALVQGIAIAKAEKRLLQGLTYEKIYGYAASSIDVVAAFDVDERKVGYTLREAIFKEPNCCVKLIQDEDELNQISNTIVLNGPVLDGVAPHMENKVNGFCIDRTRYIIDESEIQDILLEREVDILINYLPVGSQIATEFWAQVCLNTGISFLNCIPVFIASDPEWEKRFYDKGIPIIGDDMRSQFGASVLSQMLQELAFDRGHKVKCHIQQNIGGNTDFYNMMDKTRLKSKKISKENVIRSQNVIRNVQDDSFLYAGPSDYIEHYKDNKIAYFRLELEGFGGAKVEFDAKLSVQDSPNSAGVVIDAIRFLMAARKLKLRGSLRGASAFTQKTPPQQLMFSEAKNECDMLAKGEISDRVKNENM